MPEGDTLHRAARLVGDALGGGVITSVTGSHRAVVREGRRLRGRTVVAVEAIGKHLLIHISGGWSIRTHLGMTGRWDVYRPEERWRVSAGKARLVVATAQAVAVCSSAPTVEIGPTDRVLGGLGRLGPDLVTEAPDGEVVARARLAEAATVAELLLDQQVAAGIGNVYKSEVLFMERRSPFLEPARLDDEALLAVYRRAHRLLAANVGDARRSTTGSRQRGGEGSWVYGRAGSPCRRCGTIIEVEEHGRPPRLTYWCPSCQR